MCGTINFCWRCFKWILLLVVVAAAIAVPLLMRRVDGEIHRQVVTRLAEHYEAFDVDVRSAQLVEDEGIRIRGLSITERDADGPLAEAVYFEEIFMHCSTELQALISGDLEATKITLRRPTLRATRQLDGRWSIEKLLPLPKFSDARPTISIEDATVELFDPLKHPASTYTVRDVSLLLQPADRVPELSDHPEAMAFEGSLAGDYMEGVHLRGWYDASTGQWNIRGSVENIDISPELRQSLPEIVAKPLVAIDGLRGRVEVDFAVSSAITEDRSIEYDVVARLAEGRVDHERLPYPLTDVTAEARLTTDSVKLQKLTARRGRTTIEAHGVRQGYASDSPMTIEASVRQLVLDRQLMNVMPESWQESWNKFRPAGEVDVHLGLNFDGQNWSPQMHVTCHDVSFTHDKFPYRVEQGRGHVKLQYGALDVQLTAQGSGQPVYMKGTFHNPGKHATGRLNIVANGLPIDEKLLQALPGKSNDVVRSLGPQGTLNVAVQLERQDASERWSRHSQVRLNDIAVRYAKFPYPLRNVRGTLEEKNHRWAFRNLQGVSGEAKIACQGYLVPMEQGTELRLNFNGIDIALDDQLRGALSPNLQELWRQFNPQGAVRMSTELTYRSAERKVHLTIDAEPVGEGLEVLPKFFPYRLEKIQGPIHIGDGFVQFGNEQSGKMTAQHGRTTISTIGQCRHASDGSWHVTMNDLVVDRLQLRRDLLDALPLRLRRGVNELDFNGPLNLRGAMTFDGNQKQKSPIRSAWDVQLTTQSAKLDPGIKLDNVHGTVRLAGAFDGKTFGSRGWLDLDALTYRGFQLTEVRGPIWLGEDRLLLGGFPEDRQQSQTPSRITAKFYDGIVSGDGWVEFDQTSKFAIQGALAGADLSRIADEALPGASKLKGSLHVNMHLQGTSAGAHTLVGLGDAQLKNADIGELPLLVSLLKLLSGHTPDEQAFSACNVKYHINGSHVYFDEINFLGDAVSLLGKGEMDFDQQIRMVFKAIVGRDEFKVPIVSPLLKQASPLLLLIYVDGPLSNPRTTREPLPGVARFAEGLQKELNGEPNRKSLHQQATEFFESLVPGR